MYELKPCPFCGGSVSMATTGDGEMSWAFITRGLPNTPNRCTCRVFMESKQWSNTGDTFETEESAKRALADAWNKRVSD